MASSLGRLDGKVALVTGNNNIVLSCRFINYNCYLYCCCVSIIIVICICPPGALIWLINLFYSINLQKKIIKNPVFKSTIIFSRCILIYDIYEIYVNYIF